MFIEKILEGTINELMIYNDVELSEGSIHAC